MLEDSDALSKIIINGQEYDPEEAQTLIETGQKTREYEQKWNTKLDSVWPEYGRSREIIKQKDEELAQAKAQLSEFSTKQQEGSETPKDVEEARTAARKLGLTLNEDLDQAGYIKKDDLDKYLLDRDQKSQAVNQVLKEADNLEKELDGSDGRPKFHKRAILAYASAYGKTNLMEAYEEMNEEQLAPWKDAQIQAKKASSLKTLKGGGEKAPKSPNINDDNFDAILKESLWGAKES